MPQRSLRPSPAVPATLALLTAATLAACTDPGPGTCTVEIDGRTELLAIAGTMEQATATATCTRGGAPQVFWRIADTTLATVDQVTGVVTARVPGETVLIAEFGGRAPARTEKPLIVAPPYLLIPQPERLALAPLSAAQFGVSVLAHDFTPRGFPRGLTVRSTDSCVARVTSNGTVLSGRPGTTDLLVSFVAAPGVIERVPVAVAVPAAAQLSILNITTGSPPRQADAGALSGQITVDVNVGNGILARQGGRLEFRLAGQLAGTILLGPAANETGTVRVPFTIDTDARDASGARRYPNGPQTLQVSLVVPDAVPFPGCTVNLGTSITRTLTLVNP